MLEALELLLALFVLGSRSCQVFLCAVEEKLRLFILLFLFARSFTSSALSTSFADWSTLRCAADTCRCGGMANRTCSTTSLVWSMVFFSCS